MAVSTKIEQERPDDGWHPARIIPTSGIGGGHEQERRATSALLAVMKAVPDFGAAIASKAPRLPSESKPAPEAPTAEPPDFSSPGEREVGEGQDPYSDDRESETQTAAEN